jgi:hypothetical protein
MGLYFRSTVNESQPNTSRGGIPPTTDEVEYFAYSSNLPPFKPLAFPVCSSRCFGVGRYPSMSGSKQDTKTAYPPRGFCWLFPHVDIV